MSSKRAKSGFATKKAPCDIDVQNYAAFVGDLKRKIIKARDRSGLSVNRELALLYWSIGRDILTRQEREGWAPRPSTAWLVT
jgi:hypothetical protein